MHPEFTRTLEGLAATYLFFDEPLTWVEGVDDIPAFFPLAKRLGFIVRDAGGRPACEFLAKELEANNLPYVVVIDGDYDILGETEPSNKRIIRLRRHSIENYYVDEEIVESVATMFAAWTDPEPLTTGDWKRTVDEVSENLVELVTLEVANRTAGTGVAALPRRVETLCTARGYPVLNAMLVETAIARAKEAVSEEVHGAAAQSVSAFLESRPFIHLLEGHLVFGLLRRTLIQCISRKRRKPACEDVGWIAQFGRAMWEEPLPDDHRRLAESIQVAVEEARALRAA